MKKLFLLGLMTMLAGSAWAKWVMYFEAKTITYYYDPATIRKDGNMRQVWRVQELKQRIADGEKSRRMKLRFRVLRRTFQESWCIRTTPPTTCSPCSLVGTR